MIQEVSLVVEQHAIGFCRSEIEHERRRDMIGNDFMVKRQEKHGLRDDCQNWGMLHALEAIRLELKLADNGLPDEERLAAVGSLTGLLQDRNRACHLAQIHVDQFLVRPWPGRSDLSLRITVRYFSTLYIPLQLA